MLIKFMVAMVLGAIAFAFLFRVVRPRVLFIGGGVVFECAMLGAVGTYLGWFKESPSMARAMGRARERRLAAKEAQKLRAAGSR